MDTSRERSKLWVLKELPSSSKALVDFLWEDWKLDACPAGLDYLLLHCGVAFGRKHTRDWVALCSQDIPAKDISEVTLSDALLLIDRIELLWRRRLRSSPGWEANRSARVNAVNRVMKRARNLAQEAALAHQKEFSCVI
jgi:hypothetical protein